MIDDPFIKTRLRHVGRGRSPNVYIADLMPALFWTDAMFVGAQKILAGEMTGDEAGNLAAEVTQKWKDQNPDMVENYTTWGDGPGERVGAVAGAADARMLRTRPWVPYLYAAPVVALLLLVFGYPLVRVVDFSFRRIRGDSGPWIGLENYRLVLDDPTFREAVKHSAMLLLAVPVMLAISVVVALLLYERMRGWRVYRSVLFIPYILAVPIVGIVASYMFQFNGVVNTVPRRRSASARWSRTGSAPRTGRCGRS